jgi:RNA polymerase sigma factor (sigma-70 family)
VIQADLVQEVALRAWRRLSTGDGLIPHDDNDLRGWILLLAHDVCVDRFRLRDREPQKGSPRACTPDSHPAEHIQAEDLEHFEAMIEPIRRPDWYHVVWLHCVESWTFPEIALEMDVPEGTIRQWFARALELLRVSGSIPPQA